MANFPHEGEGLTDGQLLESYVHSREEAAFAALVRRHGPMVWGVCRRVLRGHQDAEDAFQATFLVLVRKAATVRPRDMVAPWLYGVAHQTALKARAIAARQWAREKQVSAMPAPTVERPSLVDDLLALLDQELSRLPEKYRSVLVLCDLHGKTRKEAARHFRLPEGTVASRLATARAMLARRLTRSVGSVSGAAVAAVLAQQAATAGVPLAVTSSTIRAASLFAAGQAAAAGTLSVKAVALAEGVLKTMLLTKLKMATAVLAAVAVLGVGAVALTQQAPADKPAERPVKPRTEPAEQPARAQQAVEPLPLVISGLVKAVDAQEATLTVSRKEGEIILRVTRDAKITIDGKPGDLAGVPRGANVTLREFADPRTARNVLAEGRWFWGVLKAVDVANNTVTFDAKGAADVAGKTFRVLPDASVAIDGQPGKLSDVPPGSFVNVTLTVDQQVVRSVAAQGPRVAGVVKAVDAGKNTITVDDTTYAVAQGTDIVIDGKRGPLAEVPVGTNVGLNLRVDGKTVRMIQTKAP
jgi:RNA polymerase sigma factor (sigma-70 family)